MADDTKPPLNALTATENWQRYEYGRLRGHRDYCFQARRCEQFYLGGGEQWCEEDKSILKEQGRPFYEFNEIMPSCNSAIGYQIHNRMDIAFKPRGGNADQQQALIRSKIAMQIADDNKLHWQETQVFSDGLIQQRGFFDIRMDFSENLQGDIRVTTLDPMDVIPDPDAKGYDPDTWADVIVTRWLTLDEIEQLYGKDKRLLCENAHIDERDFGDGGEDEPRNKFGNSNSGNSYDSTYGDATVRRVRVIDRQRWVYTMAKVAVWPETGDVRVVDGLPDQEIADQVARGAVLSKRMAKRVKWTVTTYDVILHDDWSPYRHFTIVPYFAYFRRGKTRGMVDNGIGPQEALNKAVSQFVHIINTSANSGWIIEQNSLTNMDATDLEAVGAKTGLVLEHKTGSAEPKKILPNPIPTGVDRLIDRATNALKDVTVPEAMRGVNGPEVAGIAIQAKQFASQQQLAMPLDNLAHTRHLMAVRMLDLMQGFYTEPRVFRITENDPQSGQPVTKEIGVNQYDPATGTYTNDLTEGEYDVVITEQPMAATFEDTQFQQALEMRKAGIAVPDTAIISHSNLEDKQDILAQMQGGAKPDPLVEAQVRKIDAEIASIKERDKLVRAQAVKTGVDASYSAMQAAEVITAVPDVTRAADIIMQDAGHQPANPAGVSPNFEGGVPAIAAGGVTVQPVNNRRKGMSFTPGGGAVPAAGQPGGPAPGDTSPNTPASPRMPATPGTGEAHGIETMRPDGVRGMANGGIVVDDLGLPLLGDQATHPDDPFRVGITSHPVQDFQRYTRQEDELTDANARQLASRSALAQPRIAAAPAADGFADGGLIKGPGTGTSDSIPAVTSSGKPVAVSNGEYEVKPPVVQAMGPEFFLGLIERFHQLAEGATPATGEPQLVLEDGSIVLPEDVVQAVGRKFLDELVALLTGAQQEQPGGESAT